MATTITQSTEAHSGNAAVKMESVSLLQTLLLPRLVSEPFYVDQRYGSLTGYYKFSPINIQNLFYVQIHLSQDDNLIGLGSLMLGNSQADYAQFTVNISYYAEGIPDTAIIYIGIMDTSDTHNQAGSMAFVDDVEMGGPVGITNDFTQPSQFELRQNYPNPFNPTTTIEYTIPSDDVVQLTVYNLSGKEVAVLVNEKQM